MILTTNLLRDLSINSIIISVGLTFLMSNPVIVQGQPSVSVVEDDCNGSFTVTMPIWEEDCTGGANDNELDYAHIYSEVGTGGERLIWSAQFAGNTNSGHDHFIGTGCWDGGEYVQINAERYSTSYIDEEFDDSANAWATVDVEFSNVFSSWYGETVKIRVVVDFEDDDHNINTTKTISFPTIPAPSAPRMSSSAYCDKIDVEWGVPNLPCDVSDINYQIRYKISTANTFGSWKEVGGNGNTTIYSHTGLENGESYDYQLRSYLEYGQTVYSSTTSTFTGNTLESPDQPNPPITTNDKCDETVDVSWQIDGSAQSVKVIRDGNEIDQVDMNPPNYTDMNPTPGQHHEYSVIFVNDCGESLESDPTTGIAPRSTDAPTNIQAAPAPDKITITWDHNDDIETGFIIERTFTGGGSALIIDDIPPNTTMYEDTEVNQCVTYTYKVKATSLCFEDGVGTESASAIISPDLSTAFATDGSAFRASKGYFSDKVELSWTNTLSNQTNTVKIFRRILDSGDPFSLLTTLSSGSGLYNDLFTDAGELYEYEIVAEGPCENGVIQSNRVNTIGFRRKSGIVSGSVSYEGGIAVEGVKISAEDPTNSIFPSLKFDGSQMATVQNAPSLNMGNEMIVETWIKDTSCVDSYDIITKPGAYSLGFNKSQNQFEFTVTSSGSDYTVMMHKDSLEENTWSYLAGMLFEDTLAIYLNGDLIHALHVGNIDIEDTSSDLEIGNNFSGWLKEIRIWNKGKSKQELQRDHSRFLAGNEEGLVIYLNTGEGRGMFAYDLSRIVNQYNKNHAELSDPGMWAATESPTVNQLNIATYTQSNGNYTLVIPYLGSGQSYVLTPQIGTHSFDPATRSIFIGDASSVLNGIDFTDISSFRVTGRVYYDGTNCPSKDVLIQIDGTTVISGETAVMTDSRGFFEVQVPIGHHVLSLSRQSHTFTAGRFPSNGEYDFQEPLTGLEFNDGTLRKVVGRVVGGTVEADKKPGLGRSINNIGVAQMELFPVSPNGCAWIDGQGNFTNVDTTILTDPNTGEYSVELPPLKYDVKNLEILNANCRTLFDNQVLDLTNIPFDQTVTDSVFQPGTKELIKVDSVTFHKQFDVIHRVTPSIDMMNETGDASFGGDDYYTFNHSRYGESTIDLSVNPFPFPVFTQNKRYTGLISTFEEYENCDLGYEMVDRVPVKEGVITITNNLATQTSKVINLSQDLDYDGDTLYTFIVGDPNITTNTIEEYNFIKRLEINLLSGPNSADWEPIENPIVPPPNGDKFFKGLVMGTAKVDEADFVTQGPEMVDYILRDPPGSQSFAERTVGETTTTESTWSLSAGGGTEFNLEMKAGNEFIAGLGFAIETDIEISAEAGFTANMETGIENNIIESITNTSIWATSAEPLLAGAESDLFIGSSRNYLFGVATSLILTPSNICDDNASITCYGNEIGGFRIAQEKSLAVGRGDFVTNFVYTANKIKTDEIPDLETLRNYFLSNNINYVSKLSPDHPCYGFNNDDPRLGTSACPNVTGTPSPDPNIYSVDDDDGPSYTLIRPSISYIDTVRQYNQQIRLWEEALAFNEKQKASVSDGVNYSYGGGGASFTNSVTNTSSETNQFNIELQMGQEFKTTFGTEIGGVGIETNLGLSFQQSVSSVTADTEEEEHTVSYTISDDSEWDDFTFNVYEGGDQGGPIFKVLGGRTSCPHEGAVISKYYEPGTVLSPGTIQLEQPEITISPSILYNVPQDGTAVLTMTLTNNNQVGEGWEFGTQLINTSNPNSAAVNVGSSDDLTNTWVIPAQASINRDIFVEMGNAYDYDSLLVVLHSTCQYQQGLSEERDIVDSAYFSVHFIPGCTEIELSEPGNQFVLNNSFENTLDIIAEGYDINYLNLDNLKLEFKSSNESDWTELKTFYYDTTGMNDPEVELISRDLPFTLFQWNVENRPDGPYDLRAVTDCQIASEESDVLSGYFDRINPHAFGTPSPADGILDPNDDISIRFNEIVDLGTITNDNFDIIGVLNGTELEHQESLAFDGVNDYSEIPEYNLSKRSFTIEFWTKRNSLGKQILFSQGLNDGHQLNIGFDTDDRVFFELDDKLIKSNNPVTLTDRWFHIAVVYDRENSTAEIIVDSQLGQDLSTSNTFSVDFTGAGDMYLGKSSAGTSYSFDGFMHELRLWSIVRRGAEIFAKLNKTLSGREIGLIGNWPMDEAWGNVAHDKVRGRHAVMMGASWSILPKGNAYHFDENEEYLVADSAGTLAFSRETDLTFEFWTKGMQSIDPMTVLSNGLSNGTGTNQGAWSIYFDHFGRVVVENDGTSISTPLGILDNDWHHFAAVVNRLGNISLYVDGQLVNSGLATAYREFGGPKLWVGCRGYFSGNTEMRDRHFTGYLDDIRIWNLARKPEQISRDFVNAMTGDELGLEAYYPFDNYREESGVPVLDATLDDKSMSEFAYDLSVGSGTVSYSDQTAPIKLARPVKKVNYTYSVNQDEIVISLNDDPALIENVTLDITVKGIRDLAGNFMEAPRTWIAYIDKNQVFWNEQYMEYEKQEGNPLIFEATVRNTGGSSQSYVIGNLPEWLTAVPSAGVIDPNSSLKVTFTVNPLMDIGHFTQDIYVTGDFGYNEKLVVDIKNTAIPPEWTVNPNDFQYSMNLTGTLRINDVISIDEGDIVAAYIGDELVGVTHVQYFDDQSIGLVLLSIYSHNLSGDQINFDVWDASEGRLITDVSPYNIFFQDNAVIGFAEDPVSIEAFALAKLTYNLLPGWNWLSFPNNGTSLADIPGLFSDLNLIPGDRFRDDLKFRFINDQNQWEGNLVAANVKTGYKFFVQNGGTFDYEGIFEHPDNHPIDLAVGWNWIGMIAEQNLDITTALASLNPQNGDIIKSQKRFAVYSNSFGWVGNLEVLQPQEGYLMKMAGAGQLIYPSSLNSSALRSAPLQSLALSADLNGEFVAQQLQLDPNQYPDNMNMIALIDTCVLAQNNEEWFLVAISSDGQTRGITPVNFNAEDQAFTAYLTVHGQSNDNIDFSLVKSDMSQQITIDQSELFEKDALFGTPDEPYVFSCFIEDGECPENRAVSAIDMQLASHQSRYRAAIQLSSAAVISGQRAVEFLSGREVILQSGFEVQPLSTLNVKIQDCPENK